jgi:hypothetical protein
MSKHLRRFLVAALAVVLVFSASADEGMWMPHQMKDLNLKALGLEMDPAGLYKKDGTGLMSAVVNLGGGTGEFVSPEGLILTNHHVAYGAIQRASSKEKDYIDLGFLALTRAEEIPAQGYQAGVLLGYEDVTARVKAYFKPNMTPRQRYDAYDRAQKELIAQARSWLRTSAARWPDVQRTLIACTGQIRDVHHLRPAQDLGTGGEVDNWMWPRHTCDFSFLRAYVGPDGTAADYNPANVPYEPKVWLKPSLDGFKEGDFTFVMGFPGRTYRNYTLAELKADMEDMAKRIKDTQERIKFYEDASKADKEVEIRYASQVKGLYNGLKNRQGKLEGFVKYDLVAKKAAQEKELLDWIKADPARAKKYGAAPAALEAFLTRQKAFAARSELLNGVLGGSTILSQAYNICVSSMFQADRQEQAYQNEIAADQAGHQLAERNYVFATDRELQWAVSRPAAHPDEAAGFVEGVRGPEDVASASTRCMPTIWATPRGSALPGRRPGGRHSSLAAAMKRSSVIREESKGMDREGADLKMAYEAAILEMKKGTYPPDANGTIRFTYGPVLGYDPRDAVHYLPQTTLKGVIEKDTGEFPFKVPEKIKELWKARDFGRYADPRLKDVPVCFLNTTNVTGGNSGSPVFNARGEQVGIIFDMSYESVIGDTHHPRVAAFDQRRYPLRPVRDREILRRDASHPGNGTVMRAGD